MLKVYIRIKNKFGGTMNANEKEKYSSPNPDWKLNVLFPIRTWPLVNTE